MSNLTSYRLILIQIVSIVTLFGADAPPQYHISSETVPPGGTAQVKVYADTPQSISSGQITLKFDPAFFGTVEQATVFSAAGDAVAVGEMAGSNLTVFFAARSGGIGQLPGLPVLQVSVPALATAAAGSSVTITGSATGAITIGGSLSVENAVPRAGIQPAGTVIQVKGTGFKPSMTVDLSGAAISAPRYVSPQEIDITLMEPTELTGKRLVVSDDGGARVEYFLALGNSSSPYLTFGARDTSSAEFGAGSGPLQRSYGILNPGSSPVTLTFDNFDSVNPGETTATLGPYGVLIGTPPGSARTNDFTGMRASGPVRAFSWAEQTGVVSSLSESLGASAALATPGPEQFVVTNEFPVIWTVGQPAPIPFSIHIGSQGPYPLKHFTAVVSSGGPWLSLSSSQGDACNTLLTFCPAAPLVGSINPVGLAPGSYTGSVTVAASDGTVPPATFTITLTVLPYSLLLSPDSLSFTYYPTLALNPPVQTFAVSSTSGAVAIAVAASTQDGGKWLTVNPSTATTPATLTVSINPLGLSGGKHSGTVTIAAGGRTWAVSVQLSVIPPEMVTFTAIAGNKPPAPQYILMDQYLCPAGTCAPIVTPSVSTASGGNWLSAQVLRGSFTEVELSVDPSGLGVGTYNGTLVVQSAGGNLTFPVVLEVTPTPPPPTPPVLPSGALSVQPASLNFAPLGPNQQLLVSIGGTPVDFTATLAGDPGLNLVNAGQSTGKLSIGAGAVNSGTYHGSVTIGAGGQSVVVPITLTNPAFYTPVLGAITSAASQASGFIAPGEIVSLHGSELGPFFNGGGMVHVFFDDVPATVLYAAEWQINAIAPDSLAGKQTTQVRVEYGGLSSAVWGLPVRSAAPGIFTVSSSGVGPAAVLNQDNSVNGPQRPAAAGSVIQIFATGAGLSPVSPVQVAIAGIDAAVLFAGQAPGAVSGLFQVNAIVPAGIPASSSVPLQLTVGATPSQNGATIAVK